MRSNAGVTQTITGALRIDRALRLVWNSAPSWTLVNLALTVVQGVLPLIALFLMKQIVDAVTLGVSAADKAAATQQALAWIALAALVAVVTALVRSISELAAETQAQLVTDHVADVLHAQSIAVDLEYYEDSTYYDTLHRAQQEAPYRPTSIVNGLVQVGQNSISLLGIAVLLFSLSWLLGLLLLAAALPGAFVRLLYSRRRFGYEQEQAENERRAWYYHWILTDVAHAKEVRLFNLGPLFKGRFHDLRRTLREGRLELSRRRVAADFLAQVVAALAVLGSFAVVAYQTIMGAISVGSLVMYYMAFQGGLGFLQSILRGLAGLYEDNLFLTNFYQFLDLQPKITAPPHPRHIEPPMQAGVAFRNVSFTYPSGTQQALSRIDLELRPGEVIALVGENGSGKTTLIKLLCRLYDPSAGRITLDDVDLRDLDPVSWRSQISVIFQDYIHYHLSAWENIWLGTADVEPDRARIERAAMLAGADPVIGRLPAGYDTTLGNWFEGGHELSIGEWQKIALARAFMRSSGILVLDEPSSSLDAIAEADLFLRFRELIKGRSAILISHRFSTVRMADRIYVLADGCVVESGTHQELMARNGRYAHLYQAQAGQYQQPLPENRAGGQA